MAASVHAVYFSPTGSSRTIAQEAASVLAQNLSLPHAEDWDWTFPEGRAAAYNVAAGDVLVFAFPVYGGRVPQLLLEPLERLAGQGAYVVPLAVYGNRHYDDALLESVELFCTRQFSILTAGALCGRAQLYKQGWHRQARCAGYGGAGRVRPQGSKTYCTGAGGTGAGSRQQALQGFAASGGHSAQNT